MSGTKRYELDMTHGRLFPKVLRFAVPLMLTSILELLYGAADVIVVGRFAGSAALAAVGSTAPLIQLITNLFIGLSVGTTVMVSHDYGAKDSEGTQKTVHTSILVSILGGIVLTLIGIAFGKTFLKWMRSPEEVLPLAMIYIRIYFLGMPFNMVYLFGAAALRAVGDTRRPLFYLVVSGVINVLLNLFLVIRCGMGVAGVAWATIMAQAVSAALVLHCLTRTDGYVRLSFGKLRIHRDKLTGILKIGIPAGLLETFFSISNVLIQAAVNGFGAIVVAGDAASSNIEAFIGIAMNAFHQACITFVSANIGAGKNSRISRTVATCLLSMICFWALLSGMALLSDKVLLGIYSTDGDVVAAGVIRLKIICSTNFLCGIAEVFSGALIGMGTSVIPMAVTVFGACVLRIVWIYAILPAEYTLQQLYIVFPISWAVTSFAQCICACLRKRRYPDERQEKSGDAVWSAEKER